MRYYPIFLNLEGRHVVVVGGGAVAERKILTLLKSNPEITVISPKLCEALLDLDKAEQIRTIQRPYLPGDLRGAALAFAVTDNPGVNQAVAREGEQAKIWVNVADQSVPGDFILPAVFTEGDISVAISSSGKNPALAKSVRDHLKRQYSLGLKN